MNNGSAVTAYTVTPYLGVVAQTPTLFNSTATTEIVGGLATGKAYSFKVTAANAAGRQPPIAVVERGHNHLSRRDPKQNSTGLFGRFTPFIRRSRSGPQSRG